MAARIYFCTLDCKTVYLSINIYFRFLWLPLDGEIVYLFHSVDEIYIKMIPATSKKLFLVDNTRT